jgi:hypothetical protein
MRGEPCCDIDSVALDVGVFNDDVAGSAAAT